MKYEKMIWGFLLAATGVLLLYFSPDYLSLCFLIGMVLLTGYGYIAGILKVFRFGDCFKFARNRIERACNVQTATPWNVLKEDDSVFGNELLDDEFKAYSAKVCGYEDALDEAVFPIEEQINVELIESNASDATVSQVPGILTSLGVLGTFVGLLSGLNYIAFTSVNTAIVTIETMLSGIRLAFYTSIAGVILSILFNWCYHRVWHRLNQEIKLFYEDFHKNVIPSTEEQNRKIEIEYKKKMLTLMQQCVDKKAFDSDAEE